MSNESEMIPCPHSAENMDRLADGYVLHYASREEIAAHGVCRDCAKKFRKGNIGVLAGRCEKPVKFQRHVAQDIEHQHVAFSESGGAEGVVDFDFEEVDRLAGEINSEPVAVREMVADLLARILVVCWIGTENRPSTPQVAIQRFSILCSGIRPDITQRNFAEVAAEIGVTKQASSKQTIRIQDLLKIKFTATRGDDARSHMRETRLKNPVRRNNASASPHPLKDSFSSKPPQTSDRTPSSPHE